MSVRIFARRQHRQQCIYNVFRSKTRKNRNLKKEKQIQDERNLKKIAELESNLKQKSVELQGEIQEERLQDILEDLFPEDDFEDISKGKKGGDCIQTINYKNKTKIAKIYFESKDVKSFSEEWPDKLLKDMNYSHENKILKVFLNKIFLIFHLSNIKPSAKPSAKKLLPPKQKQKEKKLLPSAEASAFGPPLVDQLFGLRGAAK